MGYRRHRGERGRVGPTTFRDDIFQDDESARMVSWGRSPTQETETLRTFKSRTVMNVDIMVTE